MKQSVLQLAVWYKLYDYNNDDYTMNYECMMIDDEGLPSSEQTLEKLVSIPALASLYISSWCEFVDL